MSYLPELPAFDSNEILVTSLCRPTAPDGYEKVEEAIQACLHPNTQNTPGLKLVSVVDSNGQTKLEGERRDGSTAELFTAASKARERGWTRMAVADNLTHRQLTAKLRPGEDPEPSVIILQTSTEPQPQVLAKRFQLKDAIRILVQNEEISVNNTMATGFNLQNIFDDYGMTLHDWNLPLFHHDSARTRAYTHTVDRVLTLKPALPLEIVDTISTTLNAPPPLSDLTAAPLYLQHTQHLLEIHALIPLPSLPAATAALNAQLQPTHPDTTAIIHPWTRPYLPASRHDFWRLWLRIQHHNEQPWRLASLFLDADPTASSSTPLILAQWQPAAHPTLVARLDLALAATAWHHALTRDKFPPPPAVLALEVHLGPEARFFVDPPPWRGVEDREAHPVFFLTRGDAERDVGELKERILRESDDGDGDVGEPFVFVEWEGEGDGGVEDMVEIAVGCQRPRWEGREYVVFVDRGSWGREGWVWYARWVALSFFFSFSSLFI